MIVLYEIVMNVLLLTALIIAAIYDYNRRIIPIFIFPVLFLFITLLSVLTGQFHFWDSLLGVYIGFISFLMMAVFYGGGGGDIIMMSALGGILGSRDVMYLIFASGLIYVVFSLIVLTAFSMKGKCRDALKKQYPYAPFVLAGWILLMLCK